MYNLRSGHQQSYIKITPTLNVGAHARCHRIVIYNLSRIEVRVQQQKRYMSYLCISIFLADSANIEILFRKILLLEYFIVK